MRGGIEAGQAYGDGITHTRGDGRGRRFGARSFDDRDRARAKIAQCLRPRSDQGAADLFRAGCSANCSWSINKKERHLVDAAPRMCLVRCARSSLINDLLTLAWAHVRFRTSGDCGRDAIACRRPPPGAAHGRRRPRDRSWRCGRRLLGGRGCEPVGAPAAGRCGRFGACGGSGAAGAPGWRLSVAGSFQADQGIRSPAKTGALRHRRTKWRCRRRRHARCVRCGGHRIPARSAGRN